MEQPEDAAGQPFACGGYGQMGYRCSHTFEFNERLRVDKRITANAHSQIITTMLTFSANSCRQPPYGRVIKKDRFDATLHHVHEEIVPADVRELMRQHRPELIFVQTRDRGYGKQHDRTQPSGHKRT